jgi:Divergent InlB B-repeat domain
VRFNSSLRHWVFGLFVFIVILLATLNVALAAQLTLSWADNSTNEDGFRIERRTSSGTYQQLTNVSSNVASFTDLNLTNSTTYCYRVLAFNPAGTSAYSNEGCATTPAANSTLMVSRSGTGNGTITSSPAGIHCGTDCSESYVNGSVVTISAIAQAGSVFAGWSGSADCTDGSITINAAMNCTATFNLVSSYMLTASVVHEATSSGTASGKVISNPVGIDCGTDCTHTYTPGQLIILSPLPAANSKFAGWTGDADCSDGSVTMNGSKTCTAKFVPNTVTITVAKAGKGKVSSSNGAIDCGAICSTTLAQGSSLSLKAVPDAGYVFSGWNGGCSGTGNCNITASANMTPVANFTSIGDKIGVYRSATGEWFLDRNGNGTWEDCNVDRCAQLFTGSDAEPLVGDWNGSGTSKLGVFDSDSSQWYLDANGNGIWDGCGIDTCSGSFGNGSDMPAVGRWSTAIGDRIAIFRRREKKWHFDTNGNEILNSCQTDKCASLNVYREGDVPVAGDWTGRGTTAVGLFRPSTGEWFLDKNANRSWNGCSRDRCVVSFGTTGDLPISGDWTGTGVSRIGVFRPSTGEWFLDRNGNGKWDGPELDTYVARFGQAGDVPVVGSW